METLQLRARESSGRSLPSDGGITLARGFSCNHRLPCTDKGLARSYMCPSEPFLQAPLWHTSWYLYAREAGRGGRDSIVRNTFSMLGREISKSYLRFNSSTRFGCAGIPI